MEDYVIFTALDEKGKNAWMVRYFDPEALRRLAQGGIKFYGKRADGTTVEVSWQEVYDPNAQAAVMAVTSEPTLAQRLDAMSTMLAELTTAVAEVNPKRKAALQAAAVTLAKFSAKTKEEKI